MSRALEHVLMTADSVGGVWTYAMQLSAELGRHGVEVTLVVMGGKPNADQTREAAALSNVSLIGSDFKLEWMDEPEADLDLSGELLLEIEAERQPDLVHINGYAHAALPFAAPVLLTAHSCVRSWWKACRGGTAPKEWNAYSERVRGGLKAADLVVAPTKSFLNEVTALYGRPRAAEVILNGRDPTLFRPGPKRQMAMAAGRLWDEAKNVRTVCEAAEGLVWPVLVAGDTMAPDGGEIRVPPNVVGLGLISSAELAQRLSEAAIFVSPARYEPFGLAILEAALSGCALILGDIPTLRELWDGAALFVDPEDRDALHCAMQDLLGDPQAAATWGTKAEARAQRYGAEAMGNAYLAAYRELIARDAAFLSQVPLRATA